MMYVRPTSDKMAASEYSRMMNIQKTANRMNHVPAQMTFPGGQQLPYHPASRASIQTGLSASYNAEMAAAMAKHQQSSSKVLNQQELPASQVSGNFSAASRQHHLQKASYPSHVYTSAYQTLVKPDQPTFHRDPRGMIIASYPHSPGQNQTHRTSNGLVPRSDSQQFSKGYEHTSARFSGQNQASDSHLLSESVKTSSSQREQSVHSKEYIKSVRQNQPTSSAQTQMHLYHHGELSSQKTATLASAFPPEYVQQMTERRSRDSQAQLHRAALESHRLAGEAHRTLSESHRSANESNRCSVDSHRAIPESHRVISESHRATTDMHRLTANEVHIRQHANLRGIADVKAQHQQKQQHQSIKIQHPQPHNIAPNSIPKEHNSAHFTPRANFHGNMNSSYSSQVHAQKLATTGKRTASSEQPIAQGSIQTGLPLDLSRVTEKAPPMSEKSERDVESPLDLSIKSRKRSADTPLSHHGRETVQDTNCKRPRMEPSRMSINHINQHYRNHLQESMESTGKSGHTQSTYHSSSQHPHQILRQLSPRPHHYKQPEAFKADNAASPMSAQVSNLPSPKKPSSIEHQAIAYQNSLRHGAHHQAHNVKSIRDTKVDLSPYPYSAYPPGSQPPPVVRCSPDSTIGQNNVSAKHPQHNLYRRNMDGSLYVKNEQHLKQSGVRKQISPRANVHEHAIEKMQTSCAPGQTHMTFTPAFHDTKPSIKSGTSGLPVAQAGSQQHPMRHLPKSTPSNAAQIKSEPHMQLFPTYTKQSLPGPLPHSLAPVDTKIKAPAQAPAVYKTLVKAPELMGMPNSECEKTINTIQPIIKLEDNPPKADQLQPKSESGVTKTKSETNVDSAKCDKYMEPLSIAIPSSKTSTKESKSPKIAPKVEPKPVIAAPPKILSRKQMIMNAVIQDENLKKFATNIPSHPVRKQRHGSEFKTPAGSSPASPPSPKMPILSPQQKTLPSVSPLHNDPPTLDLPDNPSKSKGRIPHQIPKRALEKGKLSSTTKTQSADSIKTASSNGKDQTPAPYPRTEAIRRNSLPEKTWMYQKNIPVANVAPFVHSENKTDKAQATDISRTNMPAPDSVGINTKPEETAPPEDSERKTDIINDTSVDSSKSKLMKSPKTKKPKRQNDDGQTKTKLKKVQKQRSDKNKPTASQKSEHNKDLGTKRASKESKSLRDAKRVKREKCEDAEVIVAEQTLPGEGGDIPQVEAKQEKEDDTEQDDENKTTSPGNLMSDPSLLDREGRALRRAIDQFSKMESGTKYQHNQSKVRRMSSTNKRAQELKRKAIGRNKNQGKRNIGRFSRNSLNETGAQRQSSRQLSRRLRQTRGRQQVDSDTEFENEEGDEEEEDDDDDDATEYEFDTDDFNQDRVLRKRVSLRTRKRPTKRLVADDSDSEEDSDEPTADDDDDSSGHSFVSSTRRCRQKLTRSSRNKKKSLQSTKSSIGNKQAVDRTLGSEESTDEEFDAAYCYMGDDVSFHIPAEVKKITINKATGETGLHKAVHLNYQEAIAYYLKSGAVEVNARDNAGFTALHEACVVGNLDVVRTLIEHGADVNFSSNKGVRPIHNAVECDHIEVVRLLIASGADPTLKTSSGKTLGDLSATSPMSRFIQGYSGDINGFDSDAEDNPWQFSGSFDTGNKKDTGFDIFSEIPSDPEDEHEDLFDDDVSSAVRIFDLDLYNIGRSESYVYGEDIQTQFNCNETRLRKLCTPEMDVIKIPVARFRSCFESNVVRCPNTNATTICLIKYAYFKSLKDKLIPTTKSTTCSNVSELISYRNKATERKLVNKLEDVSKDRSSPSRTHKKANKSQCVKSTSERDMKQTDKFKTSSLYKSQSCPSNHSSSITESSEQSSSSGVNNSNNNNNNTLINNNNNNNNKNNNINNNTGKNDVCYKKRVSSSPQVVIKKGLSFSSERNVTKEETGKLKAANALSGSSILPTALSKFDFEDECESN